MTITNIGYDGTVGEAAAALLFTDVGVKYGVGSFLDLQVAVGGTGDRAVTVGPGSGYGSGVRTTFSTSTNLNAALVSSGTRWDTVVLHRDWSGAGGTSSLRINQGGTTKQITQTDATPGTLDDQPLALIRSIAGSTIVQEVVDLRAFASKVHYVASSAAVPFMLPRVGARFYAADNGHEWAVVGTQTGPSTFTSTFVDLDDPGWVPLNVAGGSLVAFQAAPYMGKSRGWATLKGTLKRTGGPLVTAGADVFAATLPVGSRPTSMREFVLPEIGASPAVANTYCRARVQSDGTLWLFGDNRNINAVDLAPIHFYAEQ